MEIEIISKECIKSSSPTPYHLRNHKLSFLDLFFPPIYTPLVLYYPLNKDTNLSATDINHIVSKRLQLLKQSLSETLTRFYPLAGKIKDLFSVDCNDDGIYFVVAQVNSPLNKFLNHPDISLIDKFLPGEAKWSSSALGSSVAGVQVTTFACGGIVIGAFISHMIADGIAFSSFLKSWAADTQKNTEEAICPRFDSSSLFPHNDAYPREACMTALGTPYFKFGGLVIRRFVFDSSAISNLKVKAMSSDVQNPTRVEVVTALLGKCIMTALKGKSGSHKPLLLSQAVNLRRRATPPIPEYYMGNIIWMALALCEDEKAELCSFVCQLRQAIGKLNGDFVSRLQGEGGLLNFLEAFNSASATCSGPEDVIAFTSWCNFGFYDIDFGWGKPAWASIVGAESTSAFMNGVILMDTNVGNGVEAWVHLHGDDMAALEVDKELLEFSTVDPSPLK